MTAPAIDGDRRHQIHSSPPPSWGVPDWTRGTAGDNPLRRAMWEDVGTGDGDAVERGAA